MADAKQYVDKVDVMKDSFGWEVPVELVPIPSKGAIYDPESSLYRKENIKIKAMTAKEEDILSSAALIKEGTVLDYLIDSCVMEDINTKQMISGDRNALMIAIRITGYGPDYPVVAYCSKCSHDNKIMIDLSSIPIKRLEIQPEQDGQNLFKFVLPVTKKTIYFKFPTLLDDRDRSIKEKNLNKHIQSIMSKNVTGNLEVAIQQIEEITDRNKIKHFIMNMPEYDSRALRRYIGKNEPGMDMMWNYTCEKCGAENKSSIPITSEFFWPST